MNKILKNIFYLFLPILLGSLVGILISSDINYTSLLKPPLAPPKILFPIAWTIIYILMGLSYFLFKNKTKYSTTFESIIYYIQLLVNLLWSIIFFTLKWRFIAIIWIILLDFLVVWMIKLFYQRVKSAAILNIPYFLWILFATYLTIGIYILN